MAYFLGEQTKFKLVNCSLALVKNVNISRP